LIDIVVKRPSLSPPLKWLCVSLAPTWRKTNLLVWVCFTCLLSACGKESVINVSPEYEGFWRDFDKCEGFSTSPILRIDNNSRGEFNLLNAECHSKKYLQGAVKIKGKYLFINSKKFKIIQAPTKIDTFYNVFGYSVMEMVIKYEELDYNVGNRVYHFYKLN
jgi:hypothetical protein